VQSTVLSVDLSGEFVLGNEAGDDLVYDLVIEYRQAFAAKNDPNFVTHLAFAEAVDELLFALAGGHLNNLTPIRDQK
jgi:hypothetical protein